MPNFTETAKTELMEAFSLLRTTSHAAQGKDQLDLAQAKTLVYLAEQLARLVATLNKIEAHLAVMAIPFREATGDEQPAKTTTRTKRG